MYNRRRRGAHAFPFTTVDDVCLGCFKNVALDCVSSPTKRGRVVQTLVHYFNVFVCLFLFSSESLLVLRYPNDHTA